MRSASRCWHLRLLPCCCGPDGVAWSTLGMTRSHIQLTTERPGATCLSGRCPSWSLAIRHWSFPGIWSLVLGHLFLGCTPQSSTRDAALDSRLFARAEIIGSRGTGLGQFTKPRSLALDRSDN